MVGRAPGSPRHAIVVGTGRNSLAALRSLLDTGAVERVWLVDDLPPGHRDAGDAVPADDRVTSSTGLVTRLRRLPDGRFAATVGTGPAPTEIAAHVLAVHPSASRCSFWERCLRDLGLYTVSERAAELIPARGSAPLGASRFVVDRHGQSSVDGVFLLGGAGGGSAGAGVGEALTGAVNGQTPRDRVIYDLIWSRDRVREPDEEVVDLLGLARASAGDGVPLRFVDLGCGRGRHALHAARTGAEVVAVDHSSRAVAELRAEAAAAGLPMTVVHSDLAEWARDHRGAAEVAVCVCALHHRGPEPGELERVLRDVAAVVVPGGHLLVTLLTDISYGDREDPPGRLLLSEEDGRALLESLSGDLERLWWRGGVSRQEDVLLYDDQRREVVVSFYQATRVTVAYRTAVPA